MKRQTDSFSAVERASNAKTVPKFCATRWTVRVTTLSALLAKYRSVVQALERIADCSRGDAANEATAYLRLLSDSTFIVATVVAQAVLSFFAKRKTATLVKLTKISTYQKNACKKTEQTSFGTRCGTGLRQLLGLWEPQSQNHALPTSSTIVLMQGVTLTRLQVIATK